MYIVCKEDGEEVLPARPRVKNDSQNGKEVPLPPVECGKKSILDSQDKTYLGTNFIRAWVSPEDKPVIFFYQTDKTCKRQK